MAGQRASEAQSYAISLPQLPAGLPAQREDRNLQRAGFQSGR